MTVLVPGDIFKLEARDNRLLDKTFKFMNYCSYGMIEYLSLGDTITYLGPSTCPTTHEPLYDFYASQNAKFYLKTDHFQRYAMTRDNVNANPWWHLKRLT